MRIPPERAREIHFDAIIVDGHADTVSRILDDGEDLSVRTGKGHIDLPRMFDGGLDAQFFAAFVHPRYLEQGTHIKRVLDMVDALKTFCLKNSDRIEVAKTVADVRRLNRLGKKSCLLCIEGGHAIDDDLHVLRMFAELGVRYMTLTWNNSNNWADGCGETPRHNGLTDFGREVVREMNRLGVIVDISHVHEKTFWAAIETTTRPVMASHSSCKALCNHRRNLTDEQLRAVARNGGVVCVNFYSKFLSEDFKKRVEPIDQDLERRTAEAKQRLEGDALARTITEIDRDCFDREAQFERPPLDVLIDHIDRIVRVAGIDHVGLGSDFDGVPSLPRGIDDCARLPTLTLRLFERGYSEQDVRKILGENVLRVMEQCIGG